MELESIINFFDNYTTLYHSDNRDYEQYISDVLKEYAQKISDSSNLYGSSVAAFKLEEKELTNTIITITEGLIEVVNYCSKYGIHDGVAYNKLTEVIDSTKLFYNYVKNFRTNDLTFFRLRKHDITSGKTGYERKELFHLPFQLSRDSSSMRYSPLGHPCLYLANSLYVGWEEVRKESNYYACGMFENQDILRLVELDSTPFCDRLKDFVNDNDKFDNLIDYALLFPLTFACSLIVKKDNDKKPFKKEYLISQLLLEYSRKKFDGIRYRSTRIIGVDGFFWNYAIPTKEIGDIGYCPKLIKIFTMSEIVIFDFSEPLNISVFKDFAKNRDIAKVILNGNIYDFEKTAFAGMEYILATTPQKTDFA